MPNRKMLMAIPLALVLLAGGYALWAGERPSTVRVQGEVEATRIDLASRVSGRVADVPVDFGDRVSRGQVVVRLESPQLMASLESGRAALAVAQANRDLAFSTRPETIAAREAELAKSEADLVLAQKTYDRVSALRESSVTSAQNVDDAANKLDAALRGKEAAQANLALARNGNSPEEKAVSVAQVGQAEATVRQTEADIAELTVVSPIDGQITARMAEPGKNFAASSPLISVVDVDDAWFTFNLREDLLGDLSIGDELQIRVPALAGKVFRSRVTAINALGSYANWRATKATGDFDLRTFSLRAVPLEKDARLRPGMSALIDVKGR
ncbi:HlyD family secretion protein [Paenirhodobacter populi]|uniref:HlyD family secretion protein n=1 Tax=Paenirhodobacter populi TaxID=2306993 RepID=UPI000FE3FAAA|nr:efflux RND transporter periplasmic adaptor subunit [Sinirhodobacter populi]RWR04122.1 HlyD family efflux transporter periplasmic adaptor subunit [Sinirhodobacter populi]